MATLDDLFCEYLARVEPPATAVTRAKSAHEPLREDLEKDDFFGKYIYKTRLSGSYGRNTSTFGIKDVDVIIETSFTRQELQELARNDETEQECLLRLTQEAIRRTGRSARTRKNRRSIQVNLPEEVNDVGETFPELTMDIVPVLCERGESIEPLTIADKELKDWFDTYPISQREDSKNRNKRSSEISNRHSYKPLIKMFKAWKKVHYDGQKTPKGFILECLTASYHNPYALTWADAVRDLFSNILLAFDPDSIQAIPDVADVSDRSPAMIPIAKTLEESKDVLSTVKAHLELVKQAIEEAKDDLEQSAKTLRRVFGDEGDAVVFPLPQDLNEDNGNSRSKGPSPFVATVSKSNVTEAPPFG